MTEKFIKLIDDFYVAPQITPDDVANCAKLGFDLIINNRPDGEEPDQPLNTDISQAAREAGIDYIEIPVGRGGITDDDLNSFDTVISGKKKILGFCRTGTRSTIIRAIAAARRAVSVDDIINEAASAGYNLSDQRHVLEGMT